MAAHAHSVNGGLAAHTTRLECLEAQLQQAGSFLDALPQIRQEMGAALEYSERIFSGCPYGDTTTRVSNPWLVADAASIESRTP